MCEQYSLIISLQQNTEVTLKAYNFSDISMCYVEFYTTNTEWYSYAEVQTFSYTMSLQLLTLLSKCSLTKLSMSNEIYIKQ